jgi:hypothetical protein
MGRVTTPTHRVEYVTNVAHMTPGAWHNKNEGRPSDDAAERHRVMLNASLQPGGVNEHCTGHDGTIMHVSKVTVIRQRDGKVVAVANAPMFEVV